MSESIMGVEYTVFVLFIIGSALWPLWTKKKETQTKANYVFATGGGISMAAMMLSIARGTLGVRSFLGFPSELVYRGSAMWETVYGMVCAYPLVSIIFVPVYFSLGITSVYQYLELRFKSHTVRCLASATYIWRQILILGVTIFTPCVALKSVIGAPYWASILGITVISILFTLFGGLKAVIKADVIQGVTTILLTVAVIVQSCINVGGVAPLFTVPAERGRFNFFNFTWDLNVRVDTMSAWIGQLFMSLSLYGCQQNFVQRYCSMKSEKEVKKTLFTIMPVILVLFSLSWVCGMGIFAYYADCDPLEAGYIKRMDEILPYFIQKEFAYLPGVLGLFLGSLFNGALSLQVSNLNSLATVTFEDFLSKINYFSKFTDKQELWTIKIIGAFYGLLIMVVSYGMGFLSGVIESGLMMTSATSGPLLGVFLLAMVVPCATKKGAIVGIIISHAITTWVTIGHIIYDDKNVEMLPLSIEGCPNNATIHTIHPASFFNGYGQESNYTPAIIQNVESLYSDTNALLPFYRMTYMYYALIGTFITLFVGIIVSLIFPTTEGDIYEENLLHPWILKLSRKFPGKPRKFLPARVRPVLSEKEALEKEMKAEENMETGIHNEVFEEDDYSDGCKKEQSPKVSIFINPEEQSSKKTSKISGKVNFDGPDLSIKHRKQGNKAKTDAQLRRKGESKF